MLAEANENEGPKDAENEKLACEPVDPSDKEASKKATKYISPYRINEFDPKQKELFETLKKKVFDAVLEKKICTPEVLEHLKKTEVLNDWCFYRFLTGWQYKVDKAFPMMVKMVEYNLSFKPENVRWKDGGKVAASGFLFQTGYDKYNRPLIFIELKNDKTKNDKVGKDLKYKCLLNCLETCIKRMSTNVYQVTWVVDLKGSNFNLSTVKNLKGLFDMIGDNYPERAGRIIVLNPPFVINIIVAFIRPLLTVDQQKKYVFIAGKPADVRKKLLNFVPESQLPNWWYGGKSEFKFEFVSLCKKDEEFAAARANGTEENSPTH